MTKSQKLINDCLENYSAFQKLAEVGENFSHTARSLVIMDALISGDKSDYENIVTAQCGPDKLSFETFCRLSDHFYLFKIKPDLRQLLEIYIILDNYSRTYAAKSFLVNLPADQRQPKTREEMLLSLVRYEMVPEVARLNLSQLDKLRHALSYKQFITTGQPASGFGKAINGKVPTFEYGDDEQRIVFASIICGLAGLAGTLNLGGSLTLTEEVASDLLFLMDNRTDPKKARRLGELSEP